MKSNQLNAIALLLLATAGISADNTKLTKQGVVTLKNAGIAAAVVAVPTAIVGGYKYFLENKDLVKADELSRKESLTKEETAFLQNYAATLTQLNTKTNKLIKGNSFEAIRQAIDKDLLDKKYRTHCALRKMYYNPVKTAATVALIAAGLYAGHHYGLDTKVANFVTPYLSTAWSKIIAGAAYLNPMNLFAKKEAIKAEVKTPVARIANNESQQGL
jgi:hypothetical protein